MSRGRGASVGGAVEEKRPSGIPWQRITASDAGVLPPKASGHSVTLVDGQLYVFGGCGVEKRQPGEALPQPSSSHDLYSCRPDNNTVSWVKVETKGAVPAARWHHSATVLDGTKILIFGGFHDDTTRFNDVWVFDTLLSTWSQPLNTDSGDLGGGKESKGQKKRFGPAPLPRGEHTAIARDRQVYVFGGYGGAAVARRDFNDLFVLDVQLWSWQKLDPQGEAPVPRSGHSAALIEDKMVVYGGWSSEEQLADLHILHMEEMRWEAVEVGGNPHWNHTAVGVEACPNGLVFVFGGASGVLEGDDKVAATNAYSNAVHLLDLGANPNSSTRTEVWAEVETEAKPKPRCDTEMVYDAEGQRLLVFGGWGNRWFNDLQILDVASVVGPPYAIAALSPPSGANLGTAAVAVYGSVVLVCVCVCVCVCWGRVAEDFPTPFPPPVSVCIAILVVCFRQQQAYICP